MKKQLLFFISFLFLGISATKAQVVGEDWNNLINIQLVQGMYGGVYAQSQDTVYIVKKGFVYKSDDEAVTWSTYDTGLQEEFYDVTFSDLNTGYIVGGQGTLLTTTDAGTTWNQVSLTTTENLRAVTTTPNGSVWVVGENGTIVSSTDGVSWTETTAFTSEILLSVSFRDDLEGFLSGTNGVLYHTTDGGLSWQILPVTLNSNYATDISKVEVSGTEVYLSVGGIDYYDTISYMMYSTDLVNWTENVIYDMIVDATIYNGVGYSVGGGYMLCECCDFHIFKSMDQGGSWIDELSEFFTGNQCVTNSGYKRISMFQDQVGYVISGPRVYKTPMNYTAVDEVERVTLTLSPNPVKEGFLTIADKGAVVSSLDVKVYTIQGELLKDFNSVTIGEALDLKDLTTGMYFLEMTVDNGITQTKKFLIE